MKQVFVQHPLESIHPQARLAGEAALCAGEQGAEFFWEIHEVLFEHASEWSGSDDAVDRFKEYAGDLGLDAAAFNGCLDSGEMGSAVQAQLALGQDLGVGSVPAFRINDWYLSGAQSFAAFEQVIEAALAGEHPPPTPTPLPPGASPFDVNPTRPAYTYGGDVTLGSPKAEVVVLLFVDFASESNGTYFAQGWPELLSSYVDPGSARIVIKHYAAADSVQAVRASVAAECAGQQETFWEMHDLLFSTQEEWSAAEDAEGVFKVQAAQLGLDGDVFDACLSGDEVAEKVQIDMSIAQQNGLPPAPQFVLFYGEQATLVTQNEVPGVLDQVLKP